jgi:hypothetical protein
MDGDSPRRNALRSIPAQNVPPAPVRIAAVRSSRASRSSIAAAIRVATEMSTAFLTYGRLFVITKIRYAVSTMTVSVTVCLLSFASVACG